MVDDNEQFHTASAISPSSATWQSLHPRLSSLFEYKWFRWSSSHCGKRVWTRSSEDKNFITWISLKTGWGATSQGGSTSSTLRQVTVPVLSNSECNSRSKYQGKITRNMMCAGLLSTGGKDSCQVIIGIGNFLEHEHYSNCMECCLGRLGRPVDIWQRWTSHIDRWVPRAKWNCYLESLQRPNFLSDMLFAGIVSWG